MTSGMNPGFCANTIYGMNNETYPTWIQIIQDMQHVVYHNHLLHSTSNCTTQHTNPTRSNQVQHYESQLPCIYLHLLICCNLLLLLLVIMNFPKLHWLRARERITLKLCLLVYKAGMAWHQITYRTYVCRCQLFPPTLLSMSLVPDDVSGTDHSASLVLRHGTVCCRTFVLHQHSALSKICSRLIRFCIRTDHRLNFE